VAQLAGKGDAKKWKCSIYADTPDGPQVRTDPPGRLSFLESSCWWHLIIYGYATCVNCMDLLTQA